MTAIRQTTLRAPDLLLAKLKGRAMQQGMTLNGLILQILWEWVEKQKKAEKGVMHERFTDF